MRLCASVSAQSLTPTKYPRDAMAVIAEVLALDSLQVSFSSAAKVNDILTATSSYSVVPNSSGVAVTVKDVIVDIDEVEVDSVVLVLSPMTPGSEYTLTATDSIETSSNLMNNPGCEDAIVGPNAIPQWTVVTGGDWKARTANPDPQEGAQYFFAGVSALAELRQDVSVSVFATSIDNGNGAFTFEGFTRSFGQSPIDTSQIIVEYRDAPNTTVLDSFDSGAAGQSAIWLQVLDSARVAPVGTRTIRIRLLADRNTGSNNDGYFDDLSLLSVSTTSTTVFEARGTKMDSVLRNMPSLYTRNHRSTFRNVLQAFMKEDDAIGGNRSDFLD